MFEGLRFNHWKTSQDENGVVTLGMDRADSPVNAISRAMLDELDEIIERLEIENPSGVVIHSLKSGGFAVGADIREFVQYEAAGTVEDNIRHGQRVYERLARLACPTVAAVSGHCLGGGTELILACRQRVAVADPSTRIGLPEVMLGIHPGWGGTARLPRLIGATVALKAMLTGKAFSADKAHAVGLVDRVVPHEQLLAAAHQMVGHPRQRPFGQRFMAHASNLWPTRQILASMMRKQTAAKVRKQHYPAPFALIEVWRKGGGKIRQRLNLESRSVARLAQTPTARQLIRVFFLQEQLKKQGAETDHGIQHVHVVGAGVMGGDIAAWCAWKGFEVTLQDRELAYIEPALERARKLYAKKAHDDTQQTAQASARLKADVEGKGVVSADLVIEAIFENAQAKHALYAGIEPKFQADEILASNTSSIPLDELRTDLARPRYFLGLHFFNPVAQMPLVEVVRHNQLDATVEKRALAFCRALGKLPVAVKGTPGFLVNRILMPYLLEAMRLYHEGVPGPVLDKVAKRFGMPMGPIELADTVGLDVCASVGKELAPFLGLEIPPDLEPMLEAGKRGKKDGQGFYTWSEGKAQKPEVDKRYRPPQDLEDRLILPMLNEAVACLHDGVVDDADLLDAGVIFGTGFAPFRGGPIQYIRDTGADTLRTQLEQLAERHGDRFKPRDGWDAALLRHTSVPS
ncbi:MAG TPA: 3-hydroxyacyl-CoA dehydrogenase NAD-binding domain-containing protein [Oleiagrimonas sp.]|nr:3-hydroxyacyl-CoA dehydrogenase NAD-binding domain-containing protein [Oleiagrimonas sp.]